MFRSYGSSARRARLAYEAARIGLLLDQVRADNTRRESERNAPCRWCELDREVQS